MYQESFTLGFQDFLLSGGLRTVAWNPGGAIGVQLKSYFPSKISYADASGLILEVLSIFRVLFPCSMSWYHMAMGKPLSHVHNLAIKWFYQVWIALYPTLIIWLYGSTNCRTTCSSSRYATIAVDATLSIIVRVGLKSLHCSCPFFCHMYWSYFPLLHITLVQLICYLLCSCIWLTYRSCHVMI